MVYTYNGIPSDVKMSKIELHITGLGMISKIKELNEKSQVQNSVFSMLLLV